MARRLKGAPRPDLLSQAGAAPARTVPEQYRDGDTANAGAHARDTGMNRSLEQGPGTRKIDWTSARKHALVWRGTGGTGRGSGPWARLAVCGALGGASVNDDAANQVEPTIMSRIPRETSSKSKRPTSDRRASGEKAKGSPKPRSTHAKTPMSPEANREGRITKHERLLTLLSRPEGASIEDMMQATKWQQHSVRGFLAGTVKRKLGFALTSSKSHDEPRRYRIDTRRGR